MSPVSPASSERWGPSWTLHPWLLLPALLYRKIIERRNRHFDKRENCTRAAAPVISVGNITAGGTGKTPVVIEVVRRLQHMGAKPAILTRGYGAARGQTADEVLEFAEALPRIPVVVDADRIRGAAAAIAAEGTDCCVLDDGFQHRRLHRDLDIVLIDAMDPFGGGQLLPAGRLREPVDSLGRAGVLIITRSNQVLPEGLAFTRQELEKIAPGKPILTATVNAQGLRRVGGTGFSGDDRLMTIAELSNKRVVPVCGVGNPKSFRGILANSAKELLGRFTFPDHHRYAPKDAQRIACFAEEQRADYVICTRKDSVKLAPLWASGAAQVPLWRLEIEVRINDPAGELDARMRRLFPASPASKS